MCKLRAEIAASAQVRTGNVTVEMAVCLPILFLIMFGAIEFSRMNMLRHSIDNAAYEGARRGIVPGASASQCLAAATKVLQAVKAKNYTITVTPNSITDATTQLTVSVQLPLQSNSYVTARFLANKTLSASSTKSREFVGPLVPTSP